MRYAVDGLFAGCVDRRDDDMIRIVEAGRELFEQVAQRGAGFPPERAAAAKSGDEPPDSRRQNNRAGQPDDRQPLQPRDGRNPRRAIGVGPSVDRRWRRKRGLGDVMARGRGLLEKALAYDYVFRASQHPTAADNRVQAKGTITFDGGTAAEPLPRFKPDELGDCIDCTICVQVCPVGIDIRNGLQYECIACGACVDACDEVMAKMGFQKGLIRYTTQNALDGGKTRVVRPRVLVYGALLLALLAVFAWGVGTRTPLIAEVLRDRNALYRETTTGIEKKSGGTQIRTGE